MTLDWQVSLQDICQHPGACALHHIRFQPSIMDFGPVLHDNNSPSSMSRLLTECLSRRLLLGEPSVIGYRSSLEQGPDCGPRLMVRNDQKMCMLRYIICQEGCV